MIKQCFSLNSRLVSLKSELISLQTRYRKSASFCVFQLWNPGISFSTWAMLLRLLRGCAWECYFTPVLAKGSPVSMNKRTYFDKEFLVSKTGKKRTRRKIFRAAVIFRLSWELLHFFSSLELVGVWENMFIILNLLDTLAKAIVCLLVCLKLCIIREDNYRLDNPYCHVSPRDKNPPCAA